MDGPASIKEITCVRQLRAWTFLTVSCVYHPIVFLWRHTVFAFVLPVRGVDRFLTDF